MSIHKLLAVFALVITASGANAASLRYEIIDYYEVFRPDGSLGDPLDKGFSVSGTIVAKQLGAFLEGFASEAFISWDITEQVGSPDSIERTNLYTTGNSSWSLDQSPGRNRPVLLIDENFIYLLEDPVGTESAQNILNLSSNPGGIDQQLEWGNPEAGNALPKLWFSATISEPLVVNGRYLDTAAADWPIARRVHDPSPTWRRCLPYSI